MCVRERVGGGGLMRKDNHNNNTVKGKLWEAVVLGEMNQSCSCMLLHLCCLTNPDLIASLFKLFFSLNHTETATSSNLIL